MEIEKKQYDNEAAAVSKKDIRSGLLILLVILAGGWGLLCLAANCDYRSTAEKNRLEYAKLHEKQDKALILRYWSGAELSTDEMEELLAAAERQKEWIEDQKAARRLLSKP